MKFFFKTKKILINFDQEFLNKKKIVVILTKLEFNNNLIGLAQYKSYLSDEVIDLDKEYLSFSSYEENRNYLKNKIINLNMLKGKKLTSYKNFNLSMSLFFSFFKKFNKELDVNYKLYSTYYDYSKKNSLIFNNVLFPFYNIIPLLEPSFTVSFKKQIKKKKQIKTELIINYIKPAKRLDYCLRSIILFSNSFFFEKKFLKLSYCVLNLFLKNKESDMFKKKIASYDRLIKLNYIK